MLLHLGWLGTLLHSEHGDFADVVGQGTIPIVHDQDLAISEARASADVGITEHISASLLVPLRVVDTSIVYRDGSGMPVELVAPSIHHRNETLTGIADPLLLGAYTDRVGGIHLTGRAGLSIPLGRTEEDPFQLGDMGLQHEHIQLGTGTFNPVLALEASVGWDRWRAGAFAFTQQILYANRKGYQAGDRYAAGLFLRRALGTVWSVRGGPELQTETAERWHGIRHTDEGNQGRIDTILSAGISWAALDKLAFDFTLKVPVYTHVIGGQLDVPAIVELGAAYAFGAGHAHHHHHDDDHDEHIARAPVDTTGADVADVGKDGQRVALTPVAGKLTIFDFWAAWCEPCKNLEPILVELARTHPERVALRRVEVIDWDSPVAEQYLIPGGFGLPHVKVYDEHGTLVLERSSAPGQLGALITSVRALVEPAGTSPTAAPAIPSDALVIEIAATERGFEPAAITVPHGRSVVLRFTRTSDKTCATDVVIDHDGQHVIQDLPLNKPIAIPLVFAQPGTITYTCGMAMFHGTITVQ